MVRDNLAAHRSVAVQQHGVADDQKLRIGQLWAGQGRAGQGRAGRGGGGAGQGGTGQGQCEAGQNGARGAGRGRARLDRTGQTPDYLGIIFVVSQNDLRSHVDRRPHPSLCAGVHLMLGVPKVSNLEQWPLPFLPV